jgi:dipeptidyl aminopeptidase/acylaminoacyl peptidase
MVNEAELEELINICPTLYHMAERGSWGSIKQYGLFSTSALLDHYDVQRPKRTEIESRHRPRSVEVVGEGLPRAIVRDQIPMSDAGLRRALPDHLSPSDWYELLNTKAFFWLSEKRLHKLTNAKAYRNREHDVLEVDTRSLIYAHRDSIWLCPINSGCTKPMPHPRDETIFARISDYPYFHWRERRSRRECVVELAVEHSVKDIRDHVTRVIVKRGLEVLGVIE